MSFHVIAPKDRKRRHVLLGEDLHLIVADDHGDVRTMLVEIIGKLANRILAARVALQRDFRRDLVGKVRIFVECHHLIEVVSLALIEVLGILAIEGNAILPVLRGDRQHGAV